MQAVHAYDELTPDVILDAVERFGFRCDGSFLALNSYENRVYQVRLEDGEFIVAKFYRPHRWRTESIIEEHDFAAELESYEIPVVAPLRNAAGVSLLEHAGFQYAVYPRRGGRTPELDDKNTREWLGRYLGRIHAVAAVSPFQHRPRLDIETFGHEPRRYLGEHDVIPADVRDSYLAAADEALARVESTFEAIGGLRQIRLHGDCHPNNILWTPAGPHFVDLDDCRTGPAVQDLWMWLSGDRQERTEQINDILSGYNEFHYFDTIELSVIEALRTLRIIHYSAWLARRWSDPAFPLNFPWFASPRYWEDQINTLREQWENMEEPPLEYKYQ
jgi:Ser/Thr protein kinase RdoA (MazF antagonist)